MFADTEDRANAQKLCDIAVKGVLQQGCPSTFEDGKCAYRGINNTKCAIGFIVPDEDYNPDMETKGISAAQFSLVRKKLNISSYIADILSELQSAHDRAARETLHLTAEGRREFVDMFTETAKRLYANYGLEWNHG